jgi:hypothetical protein
MKYEEIIERLEAKGEPPIFYNEVLKLIRQLEHQLRLAILLNNRKQKRIQELEQKVQQYEQRLTNLNTDVSL